MIVHLALAAVLATTHIELSDHTIRVRDVAAGQSANDAVLAQIPSDRSTFRIPAAALARLLQRKVSTTNLKSPGGDYLFVVRPATLRRAACWRASRDIGAGEAIAADAVVASECETAQDNPHLLTDLDGITWSTTPFAQGTNLGRIWIPAKTMIGRDKPMRLISRMGPIRIEREVVTLQNGVPGGQVFVRDQTGRVFAATVGHGATE